MTSASATTSSPAPLRVGVIGVGMMGADHVDRLATRVSGATVTAISDFDTDKATTLAAPLGAAVFNEPMGLIHSELVDAVVIASPGFAHEEQVRACIGAGKPVLCEKPLTMDAASSYDLVQAEAAGGRRLVHMGFMRRFDPEFRHVKEMLRRGDLGPLLMAHSTVRADAVPASFDTTMSINDAVVHDFDVTRWLFDDEIATVTVHRPTPTSERESEELADPLYVLAETRGGRLSTVALLVNSRCGYQVGLEVVGEHGSATLGHDIGVVVKTKDRLWGGEIATDFRARFRAAYDAEFRDWVTALRTGGPCSAATAWDGYAAAAVCEAGVLAAAPGAGPQTVELSPAPSFS